MITIDGRAFLTLPEFLVSQGIHLRITFRDAQWRIDNEIVGLVVFDAEEHDCCKFDKPTKLTFRGGIQNVLRSLAMCASHEPCKLTIDGIPAYSREIRRFDMDQLNRLNTQFVTNYEEPTP